MKSRAIVGVVAVAAAMGLVLSGCGSDTKTESTSSSKTTTSKSTSTAAAAPTKQKVAPRDENAAGPNPTIMAYVKENNIQRNPGESWRPRFADHRPSDTRGLGACR